VTDGPLSVSLFRHTAADGGGEGEGEKGGRGMRGVGRGWGVYASADIGVR